MPELYNGAQYRMLTQSFDWEADDKYLILVGEGFVFVPNHVMLDEAVGSVHWEGAKLRNPTVTLSGWAGSPPADFPALTWVQPVVGALLTELIGSNDPLLATSHRLIANLSNIIQAPFYTDGFDKQVGFNTARGAEGWFSP